MISVFDKLDSVLKRYQEIEETMARPEVAVDFEQVQELAKERASLDGLVEISRRHRTLTDERVSLEGLLREETDQEMSQMAREELSQIEASLAELSEELKFALLPKDPNDEKSVIVEVRAGAGGAEASLFASDLFRSYTRYAQMHNWKVDVMDTSTSDQGGFNKIVFEIQGKGAFSRLKFERGVHRVQRVPDTETQGRIHTSTATVAVLPEADEVEVIASEGSGREIFIARGKPASYSQTLEDGTPVSAKANEIRYEVFVISKSIFHLQKCSNRDIKKVGQQWDDIL